MAKKRLWLRACAGLAILMFAVAFCTIAYCTDAGETGLFCPLFHFTGLYCPGCGSMRALSALLHLAPARAFSYQPVSTLLLPAIAVLGLVWLAGWVVTGRDIVLRRIPDQVYYGILIALLLLCVLRNLPFEALDFLRPPAC